MSLRFGSPRLPWIGASAVPWNARIRTHVEEEEMRRESMLWPVALLTLGLLLALPAFATDDDDDDDD